MISLISLAFILIIGLISDNSDVWKINKNIITNLRIRKNIQSHNKKSKKDSEEYYYQYDFLNKLSIHPNNRFNKW